jgi:hypothetical protein
MILPGLEAATDALPFGLFPLHRQRYELRCAARVGYYTHHFLPGVSTKTSEWLAPKLWYDWCREHRHPPVELFLKVKWAKVHCRVLSGGRLCHAGIAGVRRVLAGMQARGEKGHHFAHGGGKDDSGYLAWLDGPAISDGPACAAAMVDVLNEWLTWG